MDSTTDYWQRIRQAVGKETVIIPSAAGAVIHEGKILLVRHHLLKKWQIPGGLQEIGESVQQTVEREIKEELALNLIAGSLISVYSQPRWRIKFPDGSTLQQLIFFFLMEGKISPIQIQTSEIVAYDFFAPNEIPEETFDCCKQKVLDWMKFQGKVILR